MIRQLDLNDVGPARQLEFRFSPRQNVLTGDNGLGKTFVLDVLWWLLTTTWVDQQAFPWRPPAFPKVADGGGYGVPPYRFGDRGYETPEGDGGMIKPEISGVICRHDADPRKDEEVATGGIWQWDSQKWVRKRWKLQRRTPGSGVHEEQHDEAEFRPASLVVYARIDGTFAVWDAFQVKGGIANYNEAAVLMDAAEVWEGKKAPSAGVGRSRTLSRGLLEDWVSWQGMGAPEFELLCNVLDHLSEPGEPLRPGSPTRVRLDDRVDIPTLALPYGEVPVTLASAGMKRILGLAYLLVWAWTEHKQAAKLTNRKPTTDMVVLIDEVELHLHPKWQRMLLPAVHRAIGAIADVSAQFFVTTHSPMVLASLESMFDEERDDLFVLERDGRLVCANELAFGKEGDVSNWLASDVFGNIGGRSREADLAIAAAMDFMADRAEEAEENLRSLSKQLKKLPTQQMLGMEWLDTILESMDNQVPLVERVHSALKFTLPGHDDFWVQWTLAYRPGRKVGQRG